SFLARPARCYRRWRHDPTPAPGPRAACPHAVPAPHLPDDRLPGPLARTAAMARPDRPRAGHLGARRPAGGRPRPPPPPPGRRDATLGRWAAFRHYYFLVALGALAASLGGLGWGGAVRQICSDGDAAHPQPLPGAELLLLAPFLAALAGSWASGYGVERV